MPWAPAHTVFMPSHAFGHFVALSYFYLSMCPCLTHSLTLTLSFSSLTLCTRSFYCEPDYAANYVSLWGSRLKLAIREAAGDLGVVSESISHYTWKVAYWLDAKMPAGSSLSLAPPLHFQLSLPAAHPTDQQQCWVHHQMLCCKLEVLVPKSQDFHSVAPFYYQQLDVPGS